MVENKGRGVTPLPGCFSVFGEVGRVLAFVAFEPMVVGVTVLFGVVPTAPAAPVRAERA